MEFKGAGAGIGVFVRFGLRIGNLRDHLGGGFASLDSVLSWDFIYYLFIYFVSLMDFHTGRVFGFD